MRVSSSFNAANGSRYEGAALGRLGLLFSQINGTQVLTPVRNLAMNCAEYG